MMKKACALTLIFTFALSLSLSAPALAWTDPSTKYPSFDGYMAFYRSCADSDTRALVNYIENVLAGNPDLPETFDADALFAGYYGGVIKVSKADYMTRCELTEDGFRQAMFAEWATGRGNFFNSLCVTVDGVPIQFQFYRGLSGEIAVPRAENGRLLVPLRVVSECLGFTVDYLPETRQVTCTGAGGAVTFTLDSAAYSGGRLDAAPFAEDGVTYLPLRALGEALGCTVTWNQEFRTAALRTAT